MSRERTGIEGGDEVLAALEELGGEASTEEIAEQAGLNSTPVLVAAGKLGKKEMLRIIDTDRPSRGNPRWRLPQVGEAGFGA